MRIILILILSLIAISGFSQTQGLNNNNATINSSGDLNLNGSITSVRDNGVLWDDGLTVAHTVADVYYTITGLQTGTANNMTVTDSTIVIPSTGLYLIRYTLSSTHATNNTIIHACVFVDDVEDAEIEAERKIATGGDTGNYGSGGVLSLSASDVLKIKTKADKTGTQTVNHINISIFKL